MRVLLASGEKVRGIVRCLGPVQEGKTLGTRSSERIIERGRYRSLPTDRPFGSE